MLISVEGAPMQCSLLKQLAHPKGIFRSCLR